ncbi:hypothetical protein V8B55DRAFT_1556829 [Mucor lusitanicus]|uniref:BTB domain-containing protein n=2 Tax=Mucor circinelloides f. lusitanicus TaxID=29924 RepID=A0A162YHF0_MUCCL|nr:hypothetical protein FB192DRAFT_1406819 [Mucor lusitanicus]OAC98676.1 hypothetical protein MUCCIDRAFT_167123 [Mucor lusitanicus CBS 277.49]
MTTTHIKTTSKLERHLLDGMFEKAMFSDLSLVFLHPSCPFSMRFNVHKAIMSQSPFLCKLLESIEESNSSHGLEQEHGMDWQSNIKHTTDAQGVTLLTIDLASALTQCGFVLAPFQHIVRRKWQKTTTGAESSPQTKTKRSQNTNLNPLLASHIRFVLKWLYCINKQELLRNMQDKDTLQILSVAVLLDVHDLTQACVNRYTSEQLSLDSIMRDLETICQLPRGHSSYLQLRDAALLLLLRFGPDNADRLAMLPVDYMADVLSADPLFVNSEYERYCLLRSVLMSFMQSVGRITWTPKGPVDQDSKRLSGFVRPLNPSSSSRQSTYDHGKFLSADIVRSRKRKRIPSEDLEDPSDLQQQQQSNRPHLNRLSFSALVPFEKLVADASSGGVIDKATVLSYLLRTTVSYSNMTFDQLTTVRQDGIVDEGIVFRALWQREALERVLFPLTFAQTQQTQETRRRQHPIPKSLEEDRSAALNEYFDVDQSDAQEKRRRLLLGVPRFRFKSSVYIPPPSQEHGWICEQKEITLSSQDLHAFDNDESDDGGSVWSVSDNGQLGDEELSAMSSSQLINAGIEELEIGKAAEPRPATRRHAAAAAATSSKKVPYTLFKKIVYSEAETILGVSYRLQIEAQVMPRHRLVIKDDAMDQEETEEQFYADNDPNDNVLVCRFELQRDLKQIALPAVHIKKEKGAKPLKSSSSNQQRVADISPSSSSTSQSSTIQPSQTSKTTPTTNDVREKTKIHYWIHCLNRHEGIMESDRIDPEDRVLVAVTEQCEREHGEPGEMEPGYVGQVLVEADLKKGVTVDATVALEIFGFQRV